MSDRMPDRDGRVRLHVVGPERDRLADVRGMLVRAGRLPELPDALARAPAVAAGRLTVARPRR